MIIVHDMAARDVIDHVYSNARACVYVTTRRRQHNRVSKMSPQTQPCAAVVVDCRSLTTRVTDFCRRHVRADETTRR